MPERVIALSDSLRDLMMESQALRADVKSAERTRRRENRATLGMIGVLIIFVLLVLGIAWQNNEIADQTRRNSNLIADCTTAGGKCYDEGRKRTGEAVQDIYRVSVYMAECSRMRPGVSGPEFDSYLEQCVADKLKASK